MSAAQRASTHMQGMLRAHNAHVVNYQTLRAPLVLHRLLVVLVCTATRLVAITAHEVATAQSVRQQHKRLLGSVLIVFPAHVGTIKHARELRVVINVHAASTALMGPLAVCLAVWVTLRLQTAWALVKCALLENSGQMRVFMVL